MKRILITLSILATLFLFSCQKEVDFSNNNGGGGGNNPGGTLLTKLVSKSGADSSVMTFGYNSSKKIITLSITDGSGGPTNIVQERAERNSQGIIQKVILKSYIYQQAGFDSVVTIIHHDGSKYTSEVTIFDLSIITLRDSIALIYDGAGKVITEKTYIDDGISGYEEASKVDYTYSGNNVATIKSYSYDASTSSYLLGETYTYDQYDNKISPMYFGTEAFVFGSPFFISTNNPIKSTITSTGSPTQNYTTTYTYNSSNRPVTASSTIQPGNAISTGTYYYQ